MANTIWSMWGDGVLQALETLVQTRLLLCQPESWLTPSLWREPPRPCPDLPWLGSCPFSQHLQAPYRKHLKDLDAEESETLAPSVNRQQEGEVAQILGEQDDQ